MTERDRSSTRPSVHALARYWDIHAWVGVATSLVYVMFFLGGVVLFYHQLTVWEEPLPAATRPAALTRGGATPRPARVRGVLSLFARRRARHGQDRLLPARHQPLAHVVARPVAQRAIPQREKAAAFVYDLHYLWHDVTGFWLQYGAGVLVFGFLLALVTGALIQLGRFRRQLFQLRPERERRVVWSDLHKVAGVFGLPFQLVYALTGSMMVLSPLLFELSIGPVFAGDAARAAAPRVRSWRTRPRSISVPLPSPCRSTRSSLARARPSRGSTSNPSSIAVTATLARASTCAATSRGNLRRRRRASRGSHGRSKRWRHRTAKAPSASSRAGSTACTRWNTAAPRRALLLILALGGCVTLLTGNWVWLERAPQTPEPRRRAARAPDRGRGRRLLRRARRAAPSSRLLPLEWTGRIAAEELTLVLTFTLSIAYAFAAPSVWRAYRGLLSVAAASFCRCRCRPAPLAGRLARGRTHDPSVVFVDAAFLCFGAMLLAVTFALLRVREPAVSPSSPRLATCRLYRSRDSW